MTADADFLDDLVARLFRLREAMGSGAYREACLKAAVAVARVALLEAEDRAARQRPKPRRPAGGNCAVLPFPPRGRKGDGGEAG